MTMWKAVRGGALVAAVAALVAAFPSIKRYWKISTM